MPCGSASSASWNFNPRPPLRGATPPCLPQCPERTNFNPRPPCGERRRGLLGTGQRAFISIHAPLAGSDPSARRPARRRQHFNPRPPCGERRWLPLRHRSALTYFNPRPPCGERQAIDGNFITCTPFQSTPPLRGATAPGIVKRIADYISIHAPLAGSDVRSRISSAAISSFQSTPPLRGATHFRRCGLLVLGISIHAPLAGSDWLGVE